MECKREWNREFIDIHLTQTFRKGPLRQHRRRVLMDREKGRLPAMQAFVEAQATIEVATKRIAEIRAQRVALKSRINKFNIFYRREDAPEEYRTEDQEDLERKLEPLITERARLKTQRRIQENALWEARRLLTGQARPEARQFIMKCPAEECRGFLSTAWKCGTCQKFFCADCHAEKTGQKDDEHVCKEDAKATASLIRQETRPCPKCGIRITKVEGCFAKDTPILRWDGHYCNAQDIKVGDVLVGDDGTPRIVETLCSGGDEMFEVTQGKGITYIVNSKHKLALKFSGEKSIYWKESEQAWNTRWFDRVELHMKSKKSRVTEDISKEEAYTLLDAFCQTLDFDDIIEITIHDYMRLSESSKKHLMGFKSQGVLWESKDVPLDAYLLGIWLGDGINDGMSFAVNPDADPEILLFLLDWCEKNNAELIHDEAYRFRIRRRGASLSRSAIGHGASCNECKGCKDKVCTLCDLPNKPYIDNVPTELRHPLKEHLDKYDLSRKEKYIPNDYLINSREVRLQVLAGLIDTDGYVGNDGKRIQISQANHTLGKQIEFLAHSLGFVVHSDILKKHQVPFPNMEERRDYADHYRVNISGEHLSEIPTRVARKKCVNSNSTKDELRTSIVVKPIGQGTYYGWSLSGSNRRFLLADFTVARNCDQMWCVSCHTTFSWNTGQLLLNTVVHNPHYYEYLRRTNNGAVPREAGDVPCGGLPNAYGFTRLVQRALQQRGRTIDTTRFITDQEGTEIMDCLRCLSDIQYIRLPQYPLRPNANVNQAIDIQYLMNKLTEEEWGTALERTETNGERKREIGLILQTLLHVGSEKYTAVQNATTDYNPLLKSLLAEMRQVLDYTNKSLLEKGMQMGIVVPQVTKEWRWGWAKRKEMTAMKKKKKTTTEAQNTIVVPVPGPEPHEKPQEQPIVAAAIPAPIRHFEDSEQEEEEEQMVDVELPDGERVKMTQEQAREIFGTR